MGAVFLTYLLLFGLMLESIRSVLQGSSRGYDIDDHTYIRHCRRGVFLLDPTDTVISENLILYGEWEERSLELLLQLVVPGDVIIDGGANIGAYTVAVGT